MPSDFLVGFVRYSGGAIKPMEDAALRALCENTVSTDWSLRVVNNWDRQAGLADLWNGFFHESSEPVVVLLNSDCFVGPGWDAPLVAALRDPKIGAAGPHANQGPQCAPDAIADGDGTERGQLARMARLCRDRFAGQVRDERLYGFCLAVTRAAWRDVSGFDPAAPFYGGEEVFLTRAKVKGWRSVVAMDSFCWHVGGASAAIAARAGRMNVEAERDAGRAALAREALQ